MSAPAGRAALDHSDYLALKARGLSHTRASLTIAYKLARRSYHALRELGPAALEPTQNDLTTPHDHQRSVTPSHRR